MPLSFSDLDIATRVTRERVHGCLFAYQHAPTPELKETIAKRIGEEMHRTLDMMGISAPQAKGAFDMCALTPPTKIASTAARDITAVLRAYDAAAADLFEVAAKDLPKPRFAAQTCEADLVTYQDAIEHWRACAQSVPDKSTWQAWDAHLAAVEAAAKTVCRIADTLRRHVDDMRADGIEHAAALMWEAEYADVDLRPRELFVECAENISAKTQQGLNYLEAELQKHLQAFVRQRSAGLASRRPTVSEKNAIRSHVLATVDKIVKLLPEVPARDRDRPVFRAAEAAARMVKEACTEEVTRSGAQTAQPLNDTLCEIRIPTGAEASFAASPTEWLTRWKRLDTGTSELLVHNSQTGVATPLAVETHGWSLRSRGGILVARCEHGQQFEVVRARRGSFAGQAVMRATHHIEDPFLFDGYDDRVAIGGNRGSIQIFRVKDNKVQSIGTFKAHNYLLSKMILGQDFLVTLGASSSGAMVQTASIWSTSSTPSFRLVGKSSAKDKFEMEPGSCYMTAYGQFLYSIDGEETLHMRRITDEKLDRTFHKSAQLGGNGRVWAFGVGEGLLAVATSGLVQVFDSRTLQETARVDLPGVIPSMVVPGPGRVHVAVDKDQPLKTFATRSFGQK